MTSLRQRCARLVLQFGLLSWMLGLTAALVHPLLVQHAICAEHGDVLELEQRGDEAQVVELVESLRTAPAPEAHEDGCVLLAVLLTAALLPAPVVLHTLPSTLPAPTLHLGTESPRGPPLVYAPKTSPPMNA